MNEKVVAITGGTRGIGKGLAEAFLAKGCAVSICGRRTESVSETIRALYAAFPQGQASGFPCDVTDYDQVNAFWRETVGRFGRIDIWINNAGMSNPQASLIDQPAERIRMIFETNLIGATFGAKVALAGMKAQGSGAFYNMEGLGSDGRHVSGLLLYGTTKYGLHYLTQGLIAEMKDTPVLVGAIRPGMVITELITGQYTADPEAFERAKRTFNLLAERVETVTPWIAQKVLENRRHGITISWLSRVKVLRRMIMAPVQKRSVFDDREKDKAG